MASCTLHLSYILLSTVATSHLIAEPPTLSHAFPAGGCRGESVKVTLSGEFPWPCTVWAPGVDVEVLEEKGQLRVTIPANLATDRIWLRLVHSTGVSMPIPLLVGQLPEIAELEPNDTRQQAHASLCSLPIVINGVLQKNGDVDGFAVELCAGQTLVAAVDAHEALGSPMDAMLQIVNSEGTVLIENHDELGLDPRIVFRAAVPGTYIVRLFAFPSEPDTKIEYRGGANYVYRLTLTTGPFVTHAVPLSLAKFVTSTSSKPQPVVIHGWNIPAGATADVQILGADIENQREHEVVASPQFQSDGIGFVTIASWAGSARLRLLPFQPTTKVMVQTAEASPYTLALPDTATLCIERPGEFDYLQVELCQDQLVSFGVESQWLDSQLVPALQVTDPQGKVVVDVPTSGDASDISITHRATEAGVYHFRIGDRFGQGGDRYHYRITVAEPKADFSLSVAADVVALPAGEDIELPVTVMRTAGVSESVGDILVEVVNLPAGVTCTAVTSRAEGDSAAAVTLRLRAAGPIEPTRIRVIGTSNAPSIQHAATTPPRFHVSFEDIWIH